MNTNPKAKSVLCFGDCNVYGHIPISEGRYPVNIRWTGVLQNILGIDYNIIEEGLTRRNSGFEDPDYEGMNAYSYITPCILSHNPLDWVIIWLGTRDHKDKFNVQPLDSAKYIERLVKKIKELTINNSKKQTQIILVAPTLVTENIHKFSKRYDTAIEKSKEIALLYNLIAQKEGILFFDAAQVTNPSLEDGMHLTPVGHKMIAKSLAKIILTK